MDVACQLLLHEVGECQPVEGSGFDLGFGAWGLGFRVSVFGFRFSGFQFRVSGVEFRVSSFGFRFSGFSRIAKFFDPIRYFVLPEVLRARES